MNPGRKIWLSFCQSIVELHLSLRRVLWFEMTLRLSNKKKRYIPMYPSATAAERMSSAKGNVITWNPEGSVHPVSSTCSSCGYYGEQIRKIWFLDTWGSIAYIVGVELRRTTPKARAMTFFFAIDFKRALNVRLEPAYVYVGIEYQLYQLLANQDVRAHRDKETENAWRCPRIWEYCGVWSQEVWIL